MTNRGRTAPLESRTHVFRNPSVGIELGDGALKAVQLERRGTRLVVTRADYRPYARAEDGAVRPTAGLAPRAYATLVEFLRQAAPGARDRVYVGYPSVATFNRLVRVPDVGRDALAQLAAFEAKRSLRGPLDDYEIRTRVLRRGAGETEVNCVLFAVKRSLRDAFVTDLAEAGLEFDNLVPSPSALALFVRYDRPAKGDRVAVSIGLMATEVVYLRRRGYAFRTLPIGIVGLPPAGATRAGAARRLVDRIAAEIGKGAAFYFGGDGAFRPEAVTLLGEGASIPEIVDGFQRLYPAEVEGVGELHRLAIADGVRGEAREHVAKMGSALGLAIAAARAEEAEIELVPRNRARESARRLPGLAAAALFLTVAALFAVWLDGRSRDLALAASALPAPADVLARRAVRDQLIGELEQAQARAAALQRFVAARPRRALLLEQVTALFGPEIRTFGEVDLRLASCAVERSDSGTVLRGRARGPLGTANSETVLRQRLGAVPGLRDIAVTAEPDEANASVLAFEATLAEAGGSAP